MDQDQNPPLENIDAILEIFRNKSDVGGFVIQKNNDKVEFDCHFSNNLLGKNPEEVYYTMVTIIAAMRNTSDLLTQKLASASGVNVDTVKKDIAAQYFEITALAKSLKDKTDG